jgi:hypothetical protein
LSRSDAPQPSPTRRLRKLLWFVWALAALMIVRAGLSTVSYKRLARLIKTSDRQTAPQAVLARCQWAVERAHVFVPHASCLTQAVAGRWMLGLLGYEAHIVIGVANEDPSAGFSAHAWLRSGETTVLGGSDEDVARFAPLTTLP